MGMGVNDAYLMMMRARLLALEAEIQAMVAKNTYRESLGHTIAYDEEHFYAIANQANKIAEEIAQYG